jgi:radical SAM protein with 4Fe4S-binding SPASM domain
MKSNKYLKLGGFLPKSKKKPEQMYYKIEDFLLSMYFWIMKRFWIILDKKDITSNREIPIWGRMGIEIHSDCNRDCSFCSRYADTSGVRKHPNGKHIRKKMPIEKIFNIIDQAEELGFKGIIGFHRLSEPFLDKRYIKIAAYAKQKGMRVGENSNGDILKKNTDLCNKLDGLIDEIKIGLYDYKSVDEKKEQIKFWKNRFKKTNVTFSFPNEFPLIRKDSKLSIDGKGSAFYKREKYPCYWPITGLLIRYDGEVQLCCEDNKCELELGNVFNSSLKDIWWSQKHIDVICALKYSNGRRKYSLCRECKLPGALPIGYIVQYPELNYF